MAIVTLIEASPFDRTGAVVPVRMAGGGSRGYTHKGYTDWLGGIATRPLRKVAVGYDQEGWTGSSRPGTLEMVYSAHSRTRITNVGRLVWKGARIIVSVGDDETTDGFTPIVLGIVTSVAVDGSDLKLTITDLSAELDVPACASTFAGTGDLEGDDAAAGRIKRRSWGRVFNVEGRVLNAANNIYEFGDPARGIAQFVEVRDIGRAWSAATLVSWQGSALSTLNALKAATAPQGGGAYAPSIACVKWWTQPVGPLTADMVGGLAVNLGDVAGAIMASYSTDIVVSTSDVATLNAVRPGDTGIHVDSASENISNVLDRLLLGASALWAVDPGGYLRFRVWTFDGPVKALVCEDIGRVAQFAPLLKRKVGFQRNNRVQSPGEISAAVSSNDVYYLDGSPIETLKPQEAGANVTEARQAATFYGQAALATKNNVDFNSADVTNRFAQYLAYGIFQPSVADLRPQEVGANVTENRQAQTIQGQGALATKSQANTIDLVPSAVSNTALIINPNQYDGAGPAPSTSYNEIARFTYTAPSDTNVTVIVSMSGGVFYDAQADSAAVIRVDNSGDLVAAASGSGVYMPSFSRDYAYAVSAGQTRTAYFYWRGSAGAHLSPNATMMAIVLKR